MSTVLSIHEKFSLMISEVFGSHKAFINALDKVRIIRKKEDGGEEGGEMRGKERGREGERERERKREKIESVHGRVCKSVFN